MVIQERLVRLSEQWQPSHTRLKTSGRSRIRTLAAVASNILNTPTTGSRIGLDVHGIPEAGGAVRPHIDITIKKPGVPSGPGSNLVNIKHWPW